MVIKTLKEKMFNWLNSFMFTFRNTFTIVFLPASVVQLVCVQWFFCPTAL